MGILFQANFTAANDTDVTTLTPVVGAALVDDLPTVAITANRARRTGGQDGVSTNESGGFATADYKVRAVVRYLGGDSGSAMVLKARHLNNGNCYFVGLTAAGTLALGCATGYSWSTLGSDYSIPSFTTGTDYTVDVIVAGDAISAALNGSVVIGPVTNTDHTAARQAVLSFETSNAGYDATTTAFHVSDFRVVTLDYDSLTTAYPPYFTNKTHYVALRNPDGTPATGLTYSTAGLVASYTRAASSRQPITLATQTANGAYSSGGFVEVSATNAPGLYRLDLPDAVGVGGTAGVVLSVTGTGLQPYHEFLPFEWPLEVSGTAVTGTLTASTFSVAGLTLDAGQANRRLLQFVDGPAAGERVLVVAYDGTLVQVAPPLTAAPENGNRFCLL